MVKDALRALEPGSEISAEEREKAVDVLLDNNREIQEDLPRVFPKVRAVLNKHCVHQGSPGDGSDKLCKGIITGGGQRCCVFLAANVDDPSSEFLGLCGRHAGRQDVNAMWRGTIPRDGEATCAWCDLPAAAEDATGCRSCPLRFHRKCTLDSYALSGLVTPFDDFVDVQCARCFVYRSSHFWRLEPKVTP